MTRDSDSTEALARVRGRATTGRAGALRHLGVPLLVLTLLLSGLGLFAGPRTAQAATGITSGGSIVYVKDKDIWLTSPDGAIKTRVTDDGNIPSSDRTGDSGYRSPSRSDSGNLIVALRDQQVVDGLETWVWVMNGQGQVIRKFKPVHWLRVIDEDCRDDVHPQGIDSAEVSPDGSRITYSPIAKFWFWMDPWGCVWSWAASVRVVNVDGSNDVRITGSPGSVLPSVWTPSWETNSRLLMAATSGRELWYADLPSTVASRWAVGTSNDWAHEDPDRRAGKLATRGQVLVSSPTIDWVKTLRVWSSGPAPQPPTKRCDLRTPAGGDNGVFYSLDWAPDGNALVWSEGDGTVDEPGEGIHVMAVGDPASTACPGGYVRQLLIPGGFDPHWGPAPVPGTHLTINDISVVEGNVGTTLASFTITRSGVTSGGSTVQWYTVNGTATAPSDYKAAGATPVTFAPGETTKQVSVEVNGDSTFEAAETFFAKLKAASAGTSVADGVGRATITNDDTGTTYAVNDISVVEGNVGTTLASFTITRSGVTSGGSTVQWYTVNGTATAPSDYKAVVATPVTFAPGEKTKQVSVEVNGDTTVESTEAFFVKLKSPSTGSGIADGTGRGTVVNDDRT